MNTKELFSYLIVGLVGAAALTLVGCVSESPKVQRAAIVQLTSATPTSIDCRVKVDPNGSSAIIERGVLYDTKDWKGQKVLPFEGTADTFTVRIENLLPGSVYCVRAYARTLEGVAYSPISTTFTPIAQDTVSDFEGNIYQTIRIGKQEWMVENLRSTKYNNGAAISKVTNASSWNSNTTGAYVEYAGKTDINVRGYLYNGSAVLRVANGQPMLSPRPDWRVPSKEDWALLRDHLILHGYGTANDEKAVGMSLASNSLWTDVVVPLPETIGFDLSANNKTGFHAVPAGYRFRLSSTSAPFEGDGLSCCFWSTSPIAKPIDTSDPIFHFAKLTFHSGYLILDDRTFYPKNPGASHRSNGFSVRCMRDRK